MTVKASLIFAVLCLFVYITAISYPIIEKPETFASIIVIAIAVILFLALKL